MSSIGPVNAVEIPDLYADWIQQLLQAAIPQETEATCMDCAMCATKEVERTETDSIFHTDTKCCTYFPKIPNFLAGKILNDHDPAFSQGRFRFLAQMHVFTLITPLGVLPPPTESSRYNGMTNGFGKDRHLRCPYYLEKEGGLCGIWKYRNAHCTTWFCKHVRGRTGLYFWRALSDLLQQAEEIVTTWCIHELNAGDEEFRKLFPIGEVDLETFQKQSQFIYEISKASEQFTQQTWGIWFGRERAFFDRCAEMVDSLSIEKIISLGGPRIERAARFAKTCFGDLVDIELPGFLKPNKFRSVKLNHDKIRIWGYSEYDPIDVPLHVFNAISSIADFPAQMSAEWKHKLVDFGILAADFSPQRTQRTQRKNH